MNAFVARPLVLQSAAFFLTAVLAGPAVAKNEVPFRGTIDTFEVIEWTSPTTFISTGYGTGKATHLGKFTSLWVVDVDFEANIATGPAVFTAANGDKLFTTLVGHGFPTEDPDVIFIIEEQTITGGTGRFAGATGSFVRQSFSNLATGDTFGAFRGTIVLSKGK
jgi:hypothetical protein